MFFLFRARIQSCFSHQSRRSWYQAMPFVCAALARHIYHCLKLNDPYDVEKAFQGSMPVPASEEEALSLGAELNERFEVMEASLSRLEA